MSSDSTSPEPVPSDPVLKAARLIRQGGVVVYPTETVYGLGADVLDEAAVQRVYELKGRPHTMPVSIAVSSYEMLEEIAEIDGRDMELLERLLPGPVTFLVRKRDRVPDFLTAGSPLVGVRYPDHEIALELIEASGPITSTSANPTGQPPPSGVMELDPNIVSGADMVLDGGRSRYEEPSTLVDLSARRVVRAGARIEEVLKVIG